MLRWCMAVVVVACSGSSAPPPASPPPLAPADDPWHVAVAPDDAGIAQTPTPDAHVTLARPPPAPRPPPQPTLRPVDVAAGCIVDEPAKRECEARVKGKGPLAARDWHYGPVPIGYCQGIALSPHEYQMERNQRQHSPCTCYSLSDLGGGLTPLQCSTVP